MDTNDFYKLLKTGFPFTPTLKQNIGLQQLSNFVFSEAANELFVLKGYAGTGKTTLAKLIAEKYFNIDYIYFGNNLESRKYKFFSNFFNIRK